MDQYGTPRKVAEESAWRCVDWCVCEMMGEGLKRISVGESLFRYKDRNDWTTDSFLLIERNQYVKSLSLFSFIIRSRSLESNCVRDSLLLVHLHPPRLNGVITST